jgi:hypothetical protein
MRTNSNFVSAFKCVHENSPRFVSAGEDVQQPADVRLRLLRRHVLLRGGGPVGLRRPGQGADGRLWSPAARGDLSCRQAGLGGRGGALGTVSASATDDEAAAAVSATASPDASPSIMLPDGLQGTQPGRPKTLNQRYFGPTWQSK